jgi:hypothetical protein
MFHYIISNTVHSDMLVIGSYLTKETVPGDQMTAAGSAYMFAPFGIDLEAFRHEIENGINTSERSLPMSLLLEGAAGTAATAHIFVMYSCTRNTGTFARELLFQLNEKCSDIETRRKLTGSARASSVQIFRRCSCARLELAYLEPRTLKLIGF